MDLLQALSYAWKVLAEFKVTCHYPEHSGEKKRVQGRDVISLQIAQEVQKLFGVIVPIGSGSFINNKIVMNAFFVLPLCFITY